MKKLSRKERERLERREYILDIAEQVIAEHGFDQATMDEIADKAEVGKGTLYLYFKNKTSIFAAINERGCRKLTAGMAKVLALDIPGIEMVEKLGYVYLDFIRENTLYFHAFNHYEKVLNRGAAEDINEEIIRACEEYSEEIMTYMVRSLQIGMQDGSVDEEYNPRELALVIMSAFKGITDMTCLRERSGLFKILEGVDFGVESLAKNFIKLIGKGMCKKMTDGHSKIVT